MTFRRLGDIPFVLGEPHDPRRDERVCMFSDDPDLLAEDLREQERERWGDEADAAQQRESEPVKW